MCAMHHHHRAAPVAKQRGAALVLLAIGMVALIGIAGLTLDSAHGMLNKTRLQNTVDAAVAWR